MLNEQTRNAIIKLLQSYPEKRSALIPALHLAQNEVGYLPPETQKEVADLFALAVSEVNSVVSFYDMFYEKPVGKHIIHVCKNLSCMLRGADGVLNSLCQHLQISPGGTSADGEFSIIPSECLAACDRAPMLLVDEEVVGPVREDEIQEILATTKANRLLSKLALLEKTTHFSTDLSGNFEGISKDMAEKLNGKNVKNDCFNE